MNTHRRRAEAQWNQVIGSSGDRVVLCAARNLFWRAITVVRAGLREIFDEAPYARFLERNRTPSSGSAYAAFLQEKSGGRPRPRCC